MHEPKSPRVDEPRLDPGGRPRLQRALREHGLSLTVQRRAIFESLEGRVDHPTADSVFEAVQKSMPGVSRPTVYRVLDTFVRIGLVRRVEHPGSAARYDPRTERHHHLFCSACGAVVDVELVSGRRVPFPSVVDTGIEIDDFSIHFTGRCADCAASSVGSEGRIVSPLRRGPRDVPAPPTRRGD